MGLGLRHIHVLFGWMATTLGYVLRADMSVAVVEMSDWTKQPDANVTDTGSKLLKLPVYQWDEAQKNILLSSFFWLYLVMAIPSGQLAEKFGAKLILGLSVGCASICTLLIPVVAFIPNKDYVFYAILILRILNGGFQSAIFPTTNVLISRWVTPSERSQSLAICFSGGFFGPLIGFPLAGFLVDSRFGWPAVFCVTGGLGVIWTLAWVYWGESSYRNSLSLSEEEKSHIHEAIQHDVKIERSSKTPWIPILTSPPVWAVTLSHFGFNFGYFFLLTEGPNYFRSELGVDVKNSGFLNALPYAMGCIALPVYGSIAQIMLKQLRMSPTDQRKLWNSYTLWGGAFPLLLLGIFKVTSTRLVVVLFIISVTCLTAEYYGYLTNHIHLSPNFTGTLLGISNTVATLGSLLPPLCVQLLTDRDSMKSDWTSMFFLVTFVMFTANLVYVIFGSSELQKWNEVVA